jgi:hypothetical protein
LVDDKSNIIATFKPSADGMPTVVLLDRAGESLAAWCVRENTQRTTIVSNWPTTQRLENVATSFWEICGYLQKLSASDGSSFNSAPVIQSRDPDVLPGAILPPRHPALSKTTNHAADFLLASHPAIFGSIARAIKMGSSDAYFYY